MYFIVRIILIVLFFSLPFAASMAASAKEEMMVAADIKRVEDYLNSITTLTADFLQIAPDGGASTGTFTLSRPGKLRWEYNPPVPVLIVANGSLITYYDAELKQASYVSSKSSLAAFLTRKNIRFSGDVELTKTTKSAGLLKISIIQKGKKEEGELTLICNSQPLLLRKIEVIDASGQQTSITLSDIKYGVKLDKGLFILQDLPSFKGRNS